MYVDANIAKKLRDMYGYTIGSSVFLFFEEWRNLGQQYVRQNYPERTYYNYIDRLMAVGLAVKERYGVYKLSPGWDKPLQGVMKHES